MASGLANIGRKKYTSVSALSQILGEVREYYDAHGHLPEHTSKMSIKRAREADIAQYDDHFLGPLIQSMMLTMNAEHDGTEREFLYVSPMSMLKAMLDASEHFRKLVADTLKRHPSTPIQKWSIVYYCDEVTPGDLMKRSNKRTGAFLMCQVC